MAGEVRVNPIAFGEGRGKAGLAAFIDVAYRLNAKDSNWVPPLRSEMRELLTPGKNPYFEHATVQPMIATRGGKIVGRISAHIDHLALEQPPEQGMGPGTGNWGLFEAADEDVAGALIAAAEDWLRAQGMTRSLGPLSLSIWDEPGLLVKGHDIPPAVMMGHDNWEYQSWIERCGYTPAKRLYSYGLPVQEGFPQLIDRIVKMGERNAHIRIRPVDMDRFEEEAAIIVGILNDAWSANWGFVPITDSEIAYIGKKLRPLIRPELNHIAELDGEPVAFMMTLPNVNEVLADMNGKLFPFGWIKLLAWMRNLRSKTMRVPLMGVKRDLQSSRMASQLAFMMIEYIRREAVKNYGTKRGEIGWVLEDNQGMVAIAEAINSTVSREYIIYKKAL